MFENMTFEKLMKDKLAQVGSGVDTREGSIIYDAMAPNSAETEQQYILMDWILEQLSPQTAERPYLVMMANDLRGLTPYNASAAIRKGTFNREITRGQRFSLGSYNYVAGDAIAAPGTDGKYTYQLTCETAGACGNKDFGTLLPVTDVPGLTEAVLGDVLVPGEDEEDTEAFRDRFRQSIQNIPYSGNKADYKSRCNAVAGVGATKVFRSANAAGELVGGYVTCYILDADYNIPSDQLVAGVQQAIDPAQDGSGEGIAGIGHICTIKGAEGVNIAVTSKLAYSTGYSFISLKDKLEDAVFQYLLQLRKEWEGGEKMIVRVSRIEAQLLTVAGIEDASETKINGEAANLELSDTQVPLFGSLVEG
jgi:uncharacterized phage protein gp47/JayE